MPTNLYVNNFENKPEQNLVNDLLEEVIKFHGIDVHILNARMSAQRYATRTGEVAHVRGGARYHACTCVAGRVRARISPECLIS